MKVKLILPALTEASAATHGSIASRLRHFAYAAGWKKFERSYRTSDQLPVIRPLRHVPSICA